MLIPGAPKVADLSEGATTIPEATYNVRIHKAEYVAVPKSKDAKGPYIKTQIIVTGPDNDDVRPHVGRYIFQNYSMTGDGSFRLRELLQVTGHDEDYQLTDDQELVGLEFGAAVVIQPGTNGYADKNQIRKHLPLI